MNHELLENNKVYLQGEVVDQPSYSHEVLNEGFYTLNQYRDYLAKTA